MTKIRLLIILLVLFLCACSFVDNNDKEDQLDVAERQLLEQFDEIVRKATMYAHQTGEAISVFQNDDDKLWKIEFEDGLVVLYDETTEEFTHFK